MCSASSVEEAVAPALQRMLDEAAVRRVHLNYCRGVDRRDWDLVRSCYHADALDYHGPFEGGVDEFIEWAVERMDSVVSTHFIGNQIVDVEGDVAWHEAYNVAFIRRPAGDGVPAVDWVINIRYLDRMERRDGHWRIADRLVVHDSERYLLVTGDGEVSPGWFPGGTAPDDPSYNRSATWAEFLTQRA
jgi:hypothetical protein